MTREKHLTREYALKTILILCAILHGHRLAQACSADAIGTSRVLAVSAQDFPRVGLKSYPETLSLRDKEVVLTFDDGPLPGTTDRVLESLKAECVQATFFLIGRNAAAHPHLVKAIARDGHTLANHSMTHPWTMRQMPYDSAWKNITDGRAAIEAAAGHKIAPFFRFPGFADTPALLDALAREKIAVFGTDLWASDWNVMSADTQLRLVMTRLRAQKRGIILFHDTKQQTAVMVPLLLRALKQEGYTIVHIVAK